MEFILYWIMVSSDYMIRIEVALMDRLNQNGDSWLECHLCLWQCHMLGLAVACVEVSFYSLS